MGMLVWVVVAALLYAGGFATGWKVDTWKNTAENAAQVKAASDMAVAQANWANTVATDFEGKLAKIKVVHTTINNEVRHELEKTVYGSPDCNLPESGRSLRDSAIDAANNADSSGSSPSVPADPKVNGADVGGRSAAGGSGADKPIR